MFYCLHLCVLVKMFFSLSISSDILETPKSTKLVSEMFQSSPADGGHTPEPPHVHKRFVT